jgi:hypothetical protein
MTTRNHNVIAVFVALLALASWSHGVVSAAQAAALKIVVLEGEGAVNIIQQKTAVAPVIEVRDRNDQPVSGALVRFAIQKGRATFSGARTLSVTTDAAGRATASGFTPIGSGALRIGATATFQGQTAAATIAQTTVMTTAAGGGLSPLAIAGLAGGAGAGIAGALLASKKSSGSSSSGITSLTGSFATQIVMTTLFTPGTNSCASTRSIAGTLTVEFEQHGDGSVTGTGSTTGTETEIANTGPVCQATFGTNGFSYRGPVTGSTGNLTFNEQKIIPGTNPATITFTNTIVFTGAMSNGVITGTVTYSEALSGFTIFNGSTTTHAGSGTTTFPVTLR